MPLSNKIFVAILLLAALFLNFKDDNNRMVLSRQYNDLLPSLKSKPREVLPTLEALLTKGIADLDERDTLLANLYFSVGKIYLDNGIYPDTAAGPADGGCRRHAPRHRRVHMR